MVNIGRKTGRTVTRDDPEPIGVYLRSAVAVWARGDDAQWRVVNIANPTKAYAWPILIRTFRTLHVVEWSREEQPAGT